MDIRKEVLKNWHSEDVFKQVLWVADKRVLKGHTFDQSLRGKNHRHVKQFSIMFFWLSKSLQSDPNQTTHIEQKNHMCNFDAEHSQILDHTECHRSTSYRPKGRIGQCTSRTLTMLQDRRIFYQNIYYPANIHRPGSKVPLSVKVRRFYFAVTIRGKNI